MGGLPGMPGMCPGAFQAEDVGQMTGLLRGGSGGNHCVPGDDSASPVNC